MKCRSIAATAPSGCLARIVSLTVASFRARPWDADHYFPLVAPCGLRRRLKNMYRKDRHRAAPRRRRAGQVGVEAITLLPPRDAAEFLIRTGGFKRAFGLPVSSQKPSPNAKTEQRNGDHCERKRRQPDWHAAHIEGPEDRCNHRCDCHTKKDSKGQIWLPAPGYAPQNQEQEKTGYLQQCCHDRKNPAKAEALSQRTG